MSDFIEESEVILIGESTEMGVAAGKNCYFQAFNGEFLAQDDVNILFIFWKQILETYFNGKHF